MRTWQYQIPIKEFIHDDQENTSLDHLIKVAKSIVKRIKQSVPKKWLDITHENYRGHLEDILDGLDSIDDGSFDDDGIDENGESILDYFNGWLSELYDFADAESIWLGL